MPDPPPYERDRFNYNEVRTGTAALIIVTCTLCGSAKVVSHFDGTLEEWERGHECNRDGATT